MPTEQLQTSLEMYRHYLAMVLALDDMLGELLEYLDSSGRADNTVLVFTSDHGTQAGSHGIDPWKKKHPYEESTHVPFLIRYPGFFEPGSRRDTLTAPVDLLPSLCSICGIPVPRSVEGYDLSDSWRGIPGSFEQNSLLTMNFSSRYDWFGDGLEWRGVRTKKHSYARWLNGCVELFDLDSDPLQQRNLVDGKGGSELLKQMESELRRLQSARADVLAPCTDYRAWLDDQRRVVRNAYGPLSDPEGEPDWSLLAQF